MSWITRAGLDDEVPEDPDKLRDDILRHLAAIGLGPDKTDGQALGKDRVRLSHAHQRDSVFRRERGSLAGRALPLISRFANGSEVDPAKVDPKLVRVHAGTGDADLFRLATLLWSVPVSKGYGRRMRYLVVDAQNNKLIGLFALGDPVFNLRARDEWISWDVHDREKRLVNVMDAFVLGAVPPYSQLLGGKLVASLIGSAEISRAFDQKYGKTVGLIDNEKKGARLVLVTVTSALGRSSLYNRLVLRADPTDPQSEVLVHLDRIGETAGYGHFHLAEDLFARLRRLMSQRKHEYADGHEYGMGPNWRMRLIRVGLIELGLDDEIIKHGIAREVYAMPLAKNTIEFLTGKEKSPIIERPTVQSISAAARARWIVPRSQRVPEYRAFDRVELIDVLIHRASGDV